MSETAIEVKGLHKTFKVGFAGLKKVEALRGVDLRVEPGEIYGFLGPNGAGKSTTIKVLTRLILPTKGDALVFGEPLSKRSARRRVGYLPENPVFYDFLTGTELMHHYGALLDLTRAEARNRSAELLERVGLPKAGNLQVRRYSKGMVQRLGIAQALLGDPEVVILDEPVSGLDPIGRREMRELILELKGRGKTVFFSTHIIPDVELVCDRVGILINGRMVREGPVSELLAMGAEATEVVFGGLASEKAGSMFPGATVRQVGPSVSVLVPKGASVDEVLRTGLAAGGTVESVQSQRRPMEDIFIEEISSRAPADDAPRAAQAAGSGG